MLEKLLNAVNRSPAFERFAVPVFPIGEFRKEADAGFNLETERSPILKTDVNNVVIRRDGKFHLSDDLAFCLREFENPPECFLSSAGTVSLEDSHCASQCGALVREAPMLTTSAQPVFALVAQ